MKRAWTFLSGIAVAATLALPAMADEMRARIKSVDAEHNTLTVVEGGKDYSFAVTTETKFINAKDGELANGLKSGDLKEGRRVILNYDKKEDKLVLASLKVRPQ